MFRTPASSDFERVGGAGRGCEVKEIHLRPSRDLPGNYEESEVVLSKVYTIAGRDKP